MSRSFCTPPSRKIDDGEKAISCVDRFAVDFRCDLAGVPRRTLSVIEIILSRTTVLGMSQKLPVFMPKEPQQVHFVCIRWHVRQHVAHALLMVMTRRCPQTAGQQAPVCSSGVFLNRTRPLSSNKSTVYKGTTDDGTSSSVVGFCRTCESMMAHLCWRVVYLTCCITKKSSQGKRTCVCCSPLRLLCLSPPPPPPARAPWLQTEEMPPG